MVKTLEEAESLMEPDLNQIVDRIGTDSVKWGRYGDDVLPMWVADMDFRAPAPVVGALRERVDHGVFGYGMEPSELRPIVVERLQRLYGWDVDPDALVFVPGVLLGIFETRPGPANPANT